MAKRGHYPTGPLNDEKLLHIAGQGLPPIPGLGANSRHQEKLHVSSPDAAELGIDGLRQILGVTTEEGPRVFGPASDAFRRIAQIPPLGVNRAIYRNRENIADL